MWPFKSKIPYVRDVLFENEGKTVTIIHENGVNKFNREDVLDSYYTFDEFSASKLKWFPRDFFGFHTLYALSLFGGWWSLCLSFLHDKEGLYLIFIAPIILTLPSLYITAIVQRFLAVRYNEEYKYKYRDIIVFCMNNLTLKVRANDHKSFNSRGEDWKSLLIDFKYLKKNQTRAPNKTNSLINLLFNNPTDIKLIFFGYLPLIAILLFFNWDKPFVFWDFLKFSKLSETSWFKSFIADHTETFEYFKYYKNVNPIIAFLDGMLGAIFFMLFIALGLALFIVLCILGIFVMGWFLWGPYILYCLLKNKEINYLMYWAFGGTIITGIFMIFYQKHDLYFEIIRYHGTIGISFTILFFLYISLNSLKQIRKGYK
jgi:hypothetical protein